MPEIPGEKDSQYYQNTVFCCMNALGLNAVVVVYVIHNRRRNCRKLSIQIIVMVSCCRLTCSLLVVVSCYSRLIAVSLLIRESVW